MAFFYRRGIGSRGWIKRPKSRGGPWRTRCFDQSAMSIYNQSAMSIFSQSAMSIFSQWETCNVRHTLTRDPEIAPDTRYFCRPHFFVRPRHFHWVAKFSSKFTLSPLIVKTFWSKCSVKIIFQMEMRVTVRRSCVVFEAQNTDKEN